MWVDVEGRVRNVNLPQTKPLMPLYEALMNSIDAIEERGTAGGNVMIEVLREPNEFEVGEVAGFSVIDDGVGFNDANYKSFQTSDSGYKRSLGGKGVGRFVWLAGFNSVAVESRFDSGRTLMVRSFKFTATQDGIAEHSLEEASQGSLGTIVTLAGFKPQYRKNCPKRLETIASYIVEYALEVFFRADCPTIAIRDSSTAEEIVLNDVFKEKVYVEEAAEAFEVKERSFEITHIRLTSPHTKDHTMHFCANDRVVKTERVGTRVPNLPKRLSDDGMDFYYAAYVTSTELDNRVNAERTDFTIPTEVSSMFKDDLSWTDIATGAAGRVAEYLNSYTGPVREAKKKKLEEFIDFKAPEYRPLKRYIDAHVDEIEVDGTDEEVELKLYGVYHEVRSEVKRKGVELRDTQVSSALDLPDYEAKLKSYFQKATEVSQSELARYVCQRRAILDLLDDALKKDDDGKYQKEEMVHRVVFPLRTDSDDLLPEEHNLWLLDEKLVYHKYLASDKPLKTAKPLKSASAKEPDIVVFNASLAYSPAPEAPFTSVVIVEFKRPMRDDYTGDKNPLVQVRDYIIEIREGRARTEDGRDIPVSKDVPFYCYIVCDMNEKLRMLAQDFQLIQTPDNMGYFGFNPHYNAYFEIVTYSKLLLDAKKRNMVFFERLGLPSRV
ncbi:MAG: hypothetical protein R3E76_03320 [Planctomycetota bacterium]